MSYIQFSRLLPDSQSQIFLALSKPDHLRKAWAEDVEVEVLNESEHYKKGSEVMFRMTRFGISQPLILKIDDWVKPQLMSFKQTEGPFKYWVQTIKLEPHSESATLVTESINYSLPFGLLGNLADDLFIRAELQRLLEKHLEKLTESIK